MAREFGIDLSKVVGTGPKNRILKSDLHQFNKEILTSKTTNLRFEQPDIDFSSFGPVTFNEFSKFGVTVLRNIISEYWLKQIKIGIEKNFKNPSIYKCVYEKKNGKELFYDDYCNWKRIPEYKDFFFTSGIAKIIAQLLQSKKINIFHEHVLIKEPGCSKETPWHQDQPYYCVNGKDNCSLWIPLDYVSKKSLS